MEGTVTQERANILTRIKNEYDAAQNREKLMTASYLAEVKLVADQSEKTTHYGILKREVDSTRSLYETMLQRMKEASVASALRASNIRVVDPAETPEIPYKPNVFRYITMGLLPGSASASPWWSCGSAPTARCTIPAISPTTCICPNWESFPRPMWN